ncbi:MULTISPECIES: hypothetical protein [Chitinophagaceae]
MKNPYVFLIVLFSLFVVSCGNKDYRTAQARIVERRDMGNGKIRISYLFKAGQTTIAGIKIVDNAVVVTSDSCAVEYKASNPLENTLILP